MFHGCHRGENRMIIIVSYDLTGKKDYTPFFDALKAQGEWCHYLAATWFIATNSTPEQVYNAICGQILKEDRMARMPSTIGGGPLSVGNFWPRLLAARGSSSCFRMAVRR